MIIPFDSRYRFVFLEEYDKDLKHPVSNYYTKLDDLSINLLISLKWLDWGYMFFKSLKEELDTLDEKFKLEEITLKSISKLWEEKGNKILLIDDILINNDKDFYNNLNEFYLNKEYFHENTKIHLKLKLNLNEYLLITNLMYPAFVKTVKIICANKCPLL